jgi:hypothetical protein
VCYRLPSQLQSIKDGFRSILTELAEDYVQDRAKGNHASHHESSHGEGVISLTTDSRGYIWLRTPLSTNANSLYVQVEIVQGGVETGRYS